MGFAYYYILGGIGFFFVFFFVAAGIGYLVGEAVRRASGYYRGLTTAVVAAAATVWAFVLPPVIVGLLELSASAGTPWCSAFRAAGSSTGWSWRSPGYLAWNRNR